MSLTAYQEEAAQTVVADLQAHLDQVTTDVALGFIGWNSEVRASVLQSLEADQRNIEKLKGVLLDQVRAGTKTFQSWADFAKLVHDDIAYQGQDTRNWQLWGVLRQAAEQTASDVKEGATNAVSSIGGGTGIGVALGFIIFIGFARLLR